MTFSNREKTTRGTDTFVQNLFALRRLEDFVPSAHPLRPIREMANAALRGIASDNARSE